MIKIGFVSDVDPLNMKIWSGTKFKLYEQLKSLSDVEVVWIPVHSNFKLLLYKTILYIGSKLMHKGHSFIHTTFVAKQFSKSLQNSNLLNAVDLLFVPSGAQFLYNLSTNTPIIYLADATFKSIYGYYLNFCDFFRFNITQGNKIDKFVLDKSWRIIAASDWCKNSMIEDYNISPAKIDVIEFGANIVEKNALLSNTKENSKPLSILFLGVEWERKGGAIAVQTVEYLNAVGIPAKLYVVGTNLPSQFSNIPNIISVGFLDKSKDQDYNRFISIIKSADFLLLPTIAECAGIVFCEASAYGIPILTFDTGGIKNYVRNGINGYRLPINSSAKDFALKIKEICDTNQWPILSDSAKKLYHSNLNWTVWRSKFEIILDEFKKEYDIKK